MPLVVHRWLDGTVTGTHRTGIFWGHHSLDRSSCVVVVILLLHLLPNDAIHGGIKER